MCILTIFTVIVKFFYLIYWKKLNFQTFGMSPVICRYKMNFGLKLYHFRFLPRKFQPIPRMGEIFWWFHPTKGLNRPASLRNFRKIKKSEMREKISNMEFLNWGYPTSNNNRKNQKWKVFYSLNINEAENSPESGIFEKSIFRN